MSKWRVSESRDEMQSDKFAEPYVILDIDAEDKEEVLDYLLSNALLYLILDIDAEDSVEVLDYLRNNALLKGPDIHVYIDCQYFYTILGEYVGEEEWGGIVEDMLSNVRITRLSDDYTF